MTLSRSQRPCPCIFMSVRQVAWNNIYRCSGTPQRLYGGSSCYLTPMPILLLQSTCVLSSRDLSTLIKTKRLPAVSPEHADSEIQRIRYCGGNSRCRRHKIYGGFARPTWIPQPYCVFAASSPPLTYIPTYVCHLLIAPSHRRWGYTCTIRHSCASLPSLDPPHLPFRTTPEFGNEVHRTFPLLERHFAALFAMIMIWAAKCVQLN